MSTTNTRITALEQIACMAQTLRTAARGDSEALRTIVLALTPRVIDLTDALFLAALGEDGGEEDLHTVVFGLCSEGSAQ